MLFYSCTPTFAFVCFSYSLNLGPQSMCPFGGLCEEKIEHIMWECRVNGKCWEMVENYACVKMGDAGMFVEGSWLTRYWHTMVGSYFLKGLIATYAWALWKTRCGAIFGRKGINV